MRNRNFWLVLATAVLVPLVASAQNAPLINIDEDLLSTERIFQLIALTTVLSLAPSIVMMVTSFTRIIIVFSLLRSAMGLQGTPPNTVLVSLALFLTLFIMQPTLQTAWEQGVSPYVNQQIEAREAFDKTVAPFHGFMTKHVRQEDLDLFLGYMKDKPKIEKPADVPLQALIPAFMISELRRAFEIGFLLFLPFLVIDLAIASILMSMGMMMLPPVIISLPFKIVFFVLVDGWHLLAGSLIQSFETAVKG
jgi:flagellar biosynthesis protein FliP